MSPNTIPSCVTYIKQCDHLHQLMFIVFTVQPLVCCNKNDMEEVGHDSVSDISERNKGTVNFSYSISEKEFWARYQKLSVGRFFRTDNARESVFLKNIIVAL